MSEETPGASYSLNHSYFCISSSAACRGQSPFLLCKDTTQSHVNTLHAQRVKTCDSCCFCAASQVCLSLTKKKLGPRGADDHLIDHATNNWTHEPRLQHSQLLHLVSLAPGVRAPLEFDYLGVQSHDLVIQMAHLRHLQDAAGTC